MDAAVARSPTGGRPLDRVDRPRGRPRPSTVAYWVNKHGLPSRTRRGTRPRRASAASARGAPGGGASDPRDGRAAGRQLHDGPPLAAPVRPRDTARRRAGDMRAARGAGLRRAPRPRLSRPWRHAFMRRGLVGSGAACRSDAVIARRREVKAILVAEAGGACASAATTATPAHCNSTTSTRRRSPSRSRRGRHTLAGAGRASGGREVRAPVRELSCRSRGGCHRLPFRR